MIGSLNFWVLCLGNEEKMEMRDCELDFMFDNITVFDVVFV